MSDTSSPETDDEPGREQPDEGAPPFTLVTLDLPVEEFLLAETFAELPSVEFRPETAAHSGDPVMPLVWVSGATREELERAFARDPSVERAALVEASENGSLYYVRWDGQAGVQFEILTSGDAVVLDAHGRSDGWTFEILYASREGLSETRSICEDREVDVDVRSIQELTGGPGDRFGLTDDQREALVEAHEHGYFSVPREAGLEEVAEAMDLSHQSLSERLRRGHDALVENTVRDGHGAGDGPGR